jgi:agmatine/peptidylarginine deiminase
MLTWPHAGTDWADDLAEVTPVFARIGAEIARRELLLNVCQSAQHATDIHRALRDAGAPPANLRYALARSDDTWARDHGALTVLRDGAPLVLDFRFNGWGGKFDAAHDDAITARLAEQGAFGAAAWEPQTLVLEGGAVETDGRGTLLATRHSVVTATRNPDLGSAAVEARLRETLGIERFLWLEHGALSGDDTDGHIDTLARFCDPATIVYATAAADDPDRPGLEAMRAELASLRQADGTPYRLVALPPPGIHRDRDGRRLPATYANFLILDGAVLVPVYGVANDASALRTLAECFPGRAVVGIDCRAIIRQNGSLHCLTMQFPRELPLHGALTPDDR